MLKILNWKRSPWLHANKALISEMNALSSIYKNWKATGNKELVVDMIRMAVIVGVEAGKTEVIHNYEVKEEYEKNCK